MSTANFDPKSAIGLYEGILFGFQRSKIFSGTPVGGYLQDFLNYLKRNMTGLPAKFVLT